MHTAEEFWARWREKTPLYRLAEHLTVTKQAVQQWKRVPEKHHLAVAAWYEVAPRDVRPDLYSSRKDQTI